MLSKEKHRACNLQRLNSEDEKCQREEDEEMLDGEKGTKYHLVNLKVAPFIPKTCVLAGWDGRRKDGMDWDARVAFEVSSGPFWVKYIHK